MSQDNIEFDLYGDLGEEQYDHRLKKLENENNVLIDKVRKLEYELNRALKDLTELKKQNEALSSNISSLYKTATAEVRRKDRIIEELRSSRFSKNAHVFKDVERNICSISVEENLADYLESIEVEEKAPNSMEITNAPIVETNIVPLNKCSSGSAPLSSQQTRTEYTRRLIKRIDLEKEAQVNKEVTKQPSGNSYKCSPPFKCNNGIEPCPVLVVQEDSVIVKRSALDSCPFPKVRNGRQKITPISESWTKYHSTSVKKDKQEISLESIFGSPVKWTEEIKEVSKANVAGTVFEDSCNARLETPSILEDTPAVQLIEANNSSLDCRPKFDGAKYEDSVLGQFEDTLQFVSALGKANKRLSPLTPLKDHPSDCNNIQKLPSPPKNVPRASPKKLSSNLSKTKFLSRASQKEKLIRNKEHSLKKALEMQKYIIQCGKFFRKEKSLPSQKLKTDNKPVNILIPRKTPRPIGNAVFAKSSDFAKENQEKIASSHPCSLDNSELDPCPKSEAKGHLSEAMIRAGSCPDGPLKTELPATLPFNKISRTEVLFPNLSSSHNVSGDKKSNRTQLSRNLTEEAFPDQPHNQDPSANPSPKSGARPASHFKKQDEKNLNKSASAKPSKVVTPGVSNSSLSGKKNTIFRKGRNSFTSFSKEPRRSSPAKSSPRKKCPSPMFKGRMRIDEPYWRHRRSRWTPLRELRRVHPKRPQSPEENLPRAVKRSKYFSNIDEDLAPKAKPPSRAKKVSEKSLVVVRRRSINFGASTEEPTFYFSKSDDA